jgi:hypothetical protein
MNRYRTTLIVIAGGFLAGLMIEEIVARRRGQ